MNSLMKLCSSTITIMIDTRAMISPHVKWQTKLRTKAPLTRR